MNIRSCVGCKHLVAFWCHQNRPSVYYKDPYTERSGYIPNPNLSSAEDRRKSDCGEAMVLFEPNWRYRIKRALGVKR